MVSVFSANTAPMSSVISVGMNNASYEQCGEYDAQTNFEVSSIYVWTRIE